MIRITVRNLYGLMAGIALIWLLITGYALDQYSGTRMDFKWFDYAAILATLIFPLALWVISVIATTEANLTDATLKSHASEIARFNKKCILWFVAGVVGLLIALGLLIMIGVVLTVLCVGITGWWQLRRNNPDKMAGQL